MSAGLASGAVCRHPQSSPPDWWTPRLPSWVFRSNYDHKSDPYPCSGRHPLVQRSGTANASGLSVLRGWLPPVLGGYCPQAYPSCQQPGALLGRSWIVGWVAPHGATSSIPCSMWPCCASPCSARLHRWLGCVLWPRAHLHGGSTRETALQLRGSGCCPLCASAGWRLLWWRGCVVPCCHCLWYYDRAAWLVCCLPATGILPVPPQWESSARWSGCGHTWWLPCHFQEWSRPPGVARTCRAFDCCWW